VRSYLEVTGAYDRYDQKSYGTGAIAGCSGTQSSDCSGCLECASLAAVYRCSERFDLYGGAIWSSCRVVLRVSGDVQRRSVHRRALHV